MNNYPAAVKNSSPLSFVWIANSLALTSLIKVLDALLSEILTSPLN